MATPTPCVVCPPTPTPTPTPCEFGGVPPNLHLHRHQQNRRASISSRICTTSTRSSLDRAQIHTPSRFSLCRSRGERVRRRTRRSGFYEIEQNGVGAGPDLKNRLITVRFNPVTIGAKKARLLADFTENCSCGPGEAALTGMGEPLSSTLGNISTRLSVETGDNALIGGFIVTGTQSKKVIVRRRSGRHCRFPGF